MQLFVATPPQRYRAAAFFNNNTRQVRGDEPPRVCVHAYDRARAFWRPSVWGFSRFSLLSNVTSVWWERPRETGGQSGDVPGKSHESSCWPRLLRSYHANGVSQSFERKPFISANKNTWKRICTLAGRSPLCPGKADHCLTFDLHQYQLYSL